MAIGTYLGQGGSVRDLTGCYIGQGGSVRSVDAIYVGQGGSVRLVWPPYIYDNGTYSSLGGGGMVFGYAGGSSYPQVTEESTYIMAKNSINAGSVTSGLTGAYCKSTIDMSLYKTLSMTYIVTVNGISSSTSASQRLYIGGCTSVPTSYSESCRINPQGTDYSTYVNINGSISTNTTYTLTLDVSSITSGLYVYVGYQSVSASYASVEVHITRIEVSA